MTSPTSNDPLSTSFAFRPCHDQRSHPVMSHNGPILSASRRPLSLPFSKPPATTAAARARCSLPLSTRPPAGRGAIAFFSFSRSVASSSSSPSSSLSAPQKAAKTAATVSPPPNSLRLARNSQSVFPSVSESRTTNYDNRFSVAVTDDADNADSRATSSWGRVVRSELERQPSPQDFPVTNDVNVRNSYHGSASVARDHPARRRGRSPVGGDVGVSRGLVWQGDRPRARPRRPGICEAGRCPFHPASSSGGGEGETRGASRPQEVPEAGALGARAVRHPIQVRQTDRSIARFLTMSVGPSFPSSRVGHSDGRIPKSECHCIRRVASGIVANFRKRNRSIQ